MFILFIKVSVVLNTMLVVWDRLNKYVLHEWMVGQYYIFFKQRLCSYWAFNCMKRAICLSPEFSYNPSSLPNPLSLSFKSLLLPFLCLPLGPFTEPDFGFSSLLKLPIWYREMEGYRHSEFPGLTLWEAAPIFFVNQEAGRLKCTVLNLITISVNSHNTLNSRPTLHSSGLRDRCLPSSPG